MCRKFYKERRAAKENNNAVQNELHICAICAKIDNPNVLICSCNVKAAKHPKAVVKEVSMVMELSRNEASSIERQQNMVDNAIEYVDKRFCIHLQAAGTLIPMNGDCIFSSAALSRDPSLRGDGLQTEATTLRQRLILDAIALWKVGCSRHS